jgi:hypothetical protein
MIHLPEAHYLYRIHKESMTSEILENRARPHMNVYEFTSQIRRRYPIRWYWGKIKFKLIKMRLGYDPLEKWLK